MYFIQGLRTFNSSFFLAEADAAAPIGMLLNTLDDTSPVYRNGTIVVPAVNVAPVSTHADGRVPSIVPWLSF